MMRADTRANARVVWVPSFVAFMNTHSLAAAAKAVGVTDKTVKSHIDQLEWWLHRILMDTRDDPPTPTIYAVDFFPAACEVLDIINRSELHFSIERAHITPVGIYMEDGVPLRTEETTRIGTLLVNARANLSKGTPHLPNGR